MRQAEKRKPPIIYVFGVTRSGIELRPPAPQADDLTTVLRRGSTSDIRQTWNSEIYVLEHREVTAE